MRSDTALDLNIELEFARNRERYEFLRWGQEAFDNFRVVPPGTGIVHQVNLEYLAKCVFLLDDHAGKVALPDSLVGTDSHTTMIDGLGVVGWGVGGIEAEGVMLGQPIYMLMPEVVGMQLTGKLPAGATATDLVLTVTELLRKEKVVGKFVEFFGEGVSTMSLADRATIANMSPEYGATMGFFPIDAETLNYLRRTGRTKAEVELVERYTKEQGLFRTDDAPIPTFTKTVSTRSLDGRTEPGRPEAAAGSNSVDRYEVHLETRSGRSLRQASQQRHAARPLGRGGGQPAEPAASAEMEAAVAVADPGFDGVDVANEGETFPIQHGSVVIAAITSCTNTSNPSVMIAAGSGGEEGRRKRTDGSAACEDESRTWFAGSDRLLRKVGPGQVSRPDRLQHGRLWLHDLHRQQRAASRADCQGRERIRSCRLGRVCRAIAISKAASIRM